MLLRTVPAPLQLRTQTLAFHPRTLVMGILNVTPDSFSDGGRFASPEQAVAAGLALLEQGADLLDVGGESTRPGSRTVPEEEELARVVPVIAALSRAGVQAISVDTRKAAVAEAALAAGAALVNDVSALRHDPRMKEVCARADCPVVLMHMRGSPDSMQRGEITYGDVVEEVARFLEDAVEDAVRAGLRRDNLLVDPGFGFGKTLEHNLALLMGLERLAALGRPVVWGPSRKHSLGVLAGGVPPDQRVPGTVAACVMAAERGAHVVRVHDVAAVRQALALVDACRASVP